MGSSRNCDEADELEPRSPDVRQVLNSINPKHKASKLLQISRNLNSKPQTPKPLNP